MFDDIDFNDPAQVDWLNRWNDPGVGNFEVWDLLSGDEFASWEQRMLRELAGLQNKN